MKKIIAVFLILCLTAASFTLASCSKGGPAATQDGQKKQIVTTIFPVYDWVKNITDGADAAEVSMLMDSGADLHNYQPSAADIIRITSCDLFIYIGGESDSWVEDVLQTTTNDNLIALNLMEVLGENAKEEELAEGMQAEEEEEEAEEEEGPEYDEHIWLSVKNAQILVKEIADAISGMDQEHSALYAENTDAYCDKLAALDEAYAQAVNAAETKTLVFGDRFPFRYLTDDYGLQYYAAFIGCSAETEASFETISFLSKKVDALKLHYVLTLEGTDHKIADTVIRNTAGKDQTILTMNSMQSVTSRDIQDGVDYLGIMQDNLSVLTQALSNKAGE